MLLLQAGYHVVVLDNLSSGTIAVLDRIAKLAGRKPFFIHGDIRDSALLDKLFSDMSIHGVIHFAGSKSVAESSLMPLDYYDNNVIGSVRLLQSMNRAGVKRLVFSSSATVYGDSNRMPVNEDFPLLATNPYGKTKLHIEDMLRDLHQTHADWRIAILRYFNPAGAHESGEIGENPNGIPCNLMPYISQVAAGRLEKLLVFGNDYDTPDGTGVRDYIHVMDLAKAHLSALHALATQSIVTCNIGTGRGYSVLEILNAFSQACGKPISYQFVGRRPGDVAQCYTDPGRAEELLGWKAERGLTEICADHWNWQKRNPDGY